MIDYNTRYWTTIPGTGLQFQVLDYNTKSLATIPDIRLQSRVPVPYLGHFGPPNRSGPALAVAQIPQELINAVVTEAAGEGGVLHLLVGQNHLQDGGSG